jgi:hypothetical protein
VVDFRNFRYWQGLVIFGAFSFGHFGGGEYHENVTEKSLVLRILEKTRLRGIKPAVTPKSSGVEDK